MLGFADLSLILIFRSCSAVSFWEGAIKSGLACQRDFLYFMLSQCLCLLHGLLYLLHLIEGLLRLLLHLLQTQVLFQLLRCKLLLYRFLFGRLEAVVNYESRFIHIQICLWVILIIFRLFKHPSTLLRDTLTVEGYVLNWSFDVSYWSAYSTLMDLGLLLLLLLLLICQLFRTAQFLVFVQKPFLELVVSLGLLWILT